MSGKPLNFYREAEIMCNNNCGCGGNIWWIIILVFLVCNCGGLDFLGCGCNNGCGNNDNGCGCC